jgi:hypothetical protein
MAICQWANVPPPLPRFDIIPEFPGLRTSIKFLASADDNQFEGWRAASDPWAFHISVSDSISD